MKPYRRLTASQLIKELDAFTYTQLPSIIPGDLGSGTSADPTMKPCRPAWRTITRTPTGGMISPST